MHEWLQTNWDVFSRDRDRSEVAKMQKLKGCMGGKMPGMR
jgi:hypothetical protein